jgi:phosphoribosylaminoimidazolecarboxamide formyltransferase/IMP cyclohydrolase
VSARLVVLASGEGSTLQAVLDAAAAGSLGGEVVAVGSDRPGCRALTRAAAAGVPTFARALADFPDRATWDAELAGAVAEWEPDLVVLAGFMRVLAPATVRRFLIVNTHPSLLPDFPGPHAVRDALAAGVPTSGVTIHRVDEGVDTGPVLAQQPVEVRPDDDEDSLRARIQAVEKPLYVETIRRLLEELPTVTESPAPAATPMTRSASTTRIPVRRALVSVSDKTGLAELARGLHQAGVQLVSTGSTAARIAEAGVPVTAVEDVTGFPEVLGGRVKTLHPAVHAGLLADPREAEHTETLDRLGIEAFQLVVVNLYPFRQALAAGARGDDLVEQIDIGGPAMVRAAAKNHAGVAVVVDPERYGEVLAAVGAGGFDDDERRRLAAAAFGHTAAYDTAIATWMGQELAPQEDWWPRYAGLALERIAVLRYGENPHQRAALYRDPDAAGGLATARQLHGKEMSFNNYVDADAAYRTVSDLADPAVAIVKHANPCGIAVGATDAEDPVADAHRKAHACDPVSAFGGVIAVNRPVSRELAEQIAEVFTEVVVAPGYLEGSLDVLTAKKSLRLLVVAGARPSGVEFREISGGVLAQTADRLDAPGDDAAAWRLVAGAPVDERTLGDLIFAWRAVRSVKSNAILLADDRATVGVGMGQVNRVDSARLAVARAGDRAAGAVAASDAFFPFADGLQVLLDAGVRAVVQPGGSVRDPEVVAAAEAAGVPLYLTGTRHFAH